MAKGPKTTAGGRDRALSGLAPEDALLWERVARSAKPLEGRTVAPPRAEAPPPDRGGDAPPAPPAAAEAAPRRPDLPALAPGVAPGLDKRTAARLRRGQLPLEGRIDLHGHTRAEAHAALVDFVTGARSDGRRCLLVITGKGTGDRGSEGVLKSSVPNWLNEAPLREQVLAFAHAQPRHGGQGALYVLLRRER